ncbi:MAG: DNA-protecting protein DprA, partial [Deltaproteobacteria bacterium]|nr:DNA-protecting protein DprA [Deltaproteobacteria bacterium]
RATRQAREGAGAAADPAALARAEALLARCEALGAQVVPYADPRYPPLLRLIPSPPLTLYALGDLAPAAGRPLAACVGTRQPSPWGLGVARGAARALVEEGLGVVSGLALGVDAAAHAAALDAGGYTLAVLGGALARPSPAANAPLARRILAAGGALVSELPPDAPVTPSGLVARDRLVSGLAVGLLVAQSAVDGGAMHAARFAAAQGRPRWAPPPPPAEERDARSGGLRALLAGGGVSVADAGALRAAAAAAAAGWGALCAAGAARAALGAGGGDGAGGARGAQGELFES